MSVGNFRFAVGRVDYVEDNLARTGVIVGSVIGATVLVAAVAIVIACVVSKQRNERLRQDFEKQERMRIALQHSELPRLIKPTRNNRFQQ